MNSHDLPKIGVLALMLDAYEPLFPGITDAQYRYVTEILSDLEGAADFTFPSVARGRRETEELAAQYNAMGLDGILVFLLSYAPGQYLVHAMQDNRLPLAMALVQPEETVRDDILEWDWTVNQAIHGTQDNANCLHRAGIPCQFYAGSRHGAAFRTFVADFAAAARTVRFWRRARIGVVGRLPGMGDVISDDMAVFRKLGPEFYCESIGTVQRCCAAVTEAEIDAAVEADRAIFDIDPTLPEASHRQAARMYLGIRRFLEEGDFQGLTIHFDEFGADGRFTQLPMLAASHLLAEGYGYAAEGDASAAALGAAMNVLCGDSNFSEMYMMDLKRDAVFFAHCGEGNYRTARTDRKPFLKNRVLSEGGLDNPPTPIFAMAPGRACVLSLVHLAGDQFKLLCGTGEILDECGLQYCDMPYLFFRPDCGASTFATRWLEEGGTHHEIIVPGDYAGRIRAFCRLLGVPFIAL